MQPTENTDEIPRESTDSGATLRRGQMPFWKIAILGFSAMAIGPSLAGTAGYVVLYGGNASWVGMTLATLGAAGTMYCVVLFSRRLVATGGLISYVGHTLGPLARALTAAGYLSQLLLLVGACVTGIIVFTTSFLEQVGVPNAASGLMQGSSAVVIAFAAAWFAYRGLDASVRITAILAFVPVPIVVWVTIGAMMNSEDFSLVPQFDFSGADFTVAVILPAVIIASANYLGFEGISALAAESEDPRRNVPRLLWMLMGVCGVSFILIVIAQIPLLLNNLDALNEGQSPTAILAEVAGLGFLAAPMDILLAAAFFATLVAVFNYGSRILATAAADGIVYRGLARIDPKRGTPAAAVALMALLAALVPVALQVFASAPPLLSSAYLYVLYSFLFVLPYVLAAIAAAVLLIREKLYNPIRLVIVGSSGLMWAFVLIYALVHPSGGLYSWLPWIAIAMTAVLFALFAAKYVRNPDSITDFDEI